ncbi:SCAN domain-containing protein 3 [Dictyocoela muelleri]|nr:SCAN domain-containing protein 3 [Dictyocoela muelleri]
MKPSRLKEHLEKVHGDLVEKDVSFFAGLKKEYLKQSKIEKYFTNNSSREDDGLRASYNISLLIAKAGKPHSIGEELILPAISEVIQTVLNRPSYDIIKKLSLSNSTVQRRIDEMAQDTEELLCSYLRTSLFSLQIDESTLPGNEALLLGYVRYFKDESLCQELLFTIFLETNTKGESLFIAVKKYLDEKEIPISNILSIATDGAPAMIGRHKGIVAYFKEINRGIVTIHCVIHRQHLVARNLSERLHGTLTCVIQAINRIKSNSLNSRLFTQLCNINDEEFTKLLLHTEVRWLSKGSCLNRFFILYKTVLEFLHDKDQDLHAKLSESKTDVAYLADLFDKFNDLNLKLQGDDNNFIKTKSLLSGFARKLLFYKQNLGRGELSQFQNLKSVESCDNDILAYVQHLESLCVDFNQRFEDVLSMNIPDWILDPYQSIETEESVDVHEELLEIQSDEEIKFKFKSGYHEFWLQKKIAVSYPKTWAIVQKILLPFPSSYLVERGFSVVTNLVTEKRNRLKITERGDLRLILTKIKPRIDKLIKSHQIHPSH